MPDPPAHEKDSSRRVKAACTNCKKAKARCDHQRPCLRCVERGLSDCVDAFPRRVGRRRYHFLKGVVSQEDVKKMGGEIKSTKKPRKRRSRAKKRNRKTAETNVESVKKAKLASGAAAVAPAPTLQFDFGVFDIPSLPQLVSVAEKPKLKGHPKDISDDSNIFNFAPASPPVKAKSVEPSATRQLDLPKLPKRQPSFLSRSQSNQLRAGGVLPQDEVKKASSEYMSMPEMPQLDLSSLFPEEESCSPGLAPSNGSTPEVSAGSETSSPLSGDDLNLFNLDSVSSDLWLDELPDLPPAGDFPPLDLPTLY